MMSSSIRRAPSIEELEALRLRVPPEQLSESFTRSSGPGGQNVNKVNTRVQLVFDLVNCPGLNGEEKARIGQRLRRRINKSGELLIHMSRFRAQAANREAAVALFYELLAAALSRPKARRATRAPVSAKRRRVSDKRRRGATKALRGGPGDSE